MVTMVLCMMYVGQRMISQFSLPHQMERQGLYVGMASEEFYNIPQTIIRSHQIYILYFFLKI